MTGGEAKTITNRKKWVSLFPLVARWTHIVVRQRIGTSDSRSDSRRKPKPAETFVTTEHFLQINDTGGFDDRPHASWGFDLKFRKCQNRLRSAMTGQR